MQHLSPRQGRHTIDWSHLEIDSQTALKLSPTGELVQEAGGKSHHSLLGGFRFFCYRKLLSGFAFVLDSALSGLRSRCLVQNESHGPPYCCLTLPFCT
jgi:hypothetical protein